MVKKNSYTAYWLEQKTVEFDAENDEAAIARVKGFPKEVQAGLIEIGTLEGRVVQSSEKPRLVPDPGNPGDYILEPEMTAWVGVGGFSIYLKHSADGLIIEIYCKCGDELRSVAMDWGELCSEQCYREARE